MDAGMLDGFLSVFDEHIEKCDVTKVSEAYLPPNTPPLISLALAPADKELSLLQLNPHHKVAEINLRSSPHGVDSYPEHIVQMPLGPRAGLCNYVSGGRCESNATASRQQTLIFEENSRKMNCTFMNMKRRRVCASPHVKHHAIDVIGESKVLNGCAPLITTGSEPIKVGKGTQNLTSLCVQPSYKDTPNASVMTTHDIKQTPSYEDFMSWNFHQSQPQPLPYNGKVLRNNWPELISVLPSAISHPQCDEFNMVTNFEAPREEAWGMGSQSSSPLQMPPCVLTNANMVYLPLHSYSRGDSNSIVNADLMKNRLPEVDTVNKIQTPPTRIEKVNKYLTAESPSRLPVQSGPKAVSVRLDDPIVHNASDKSSPNIDAPVKKTSGEQSKKLNSDYDIVMLADGAYKRRRHGRLRWQYCCHHGRVRSVCKQCGGSSICQHHRERSKCKECGGASVCVHHRIRSQCKECGGASICVHHRQRSTCKRCEGSSVCIHNRIRWQCWQCGGKAICVHGRNRYRCNVCKNSGT